MIIINKHSTLLLGIGCETMIPEILSYFFFFLWQSICSPFWYPGLYPEPFPWGQWIVNRDAHHARARTRTSPIGTRHPRAHMNSYPHHTQTRHPIHNHPYKDCCHGSSIPYPCQPISKVDCVPWTLTFLVQWTSFSKQGWEILDISWQTMLCVNNRCSQNLVAVVLTHTHTRLLTKNLLHV